MKQWNIEVTNKANEIIAETIAAATFKGACAKAEKIAKANKSKVIKVQIAL